MLTHAHTNTYTHTQTYEHNNKHTCCCIFHELSLCAASRMWVRHRSVVIVPPEGNLEFRWDSEMCWCFIHVTINIVSGTTQRCVMESCITHVSSFPPVVREICFLVDLDRKKKMRRESLLECVSCTLVASSFLSYPFFVFPHLPSLPKSDSVLSKTAIFLGMREGNVAQFQ